MEYPDGVCTRCDDLVDDLRRAEAERDELRDKLEKARRPVTQYCHQCADFSKTLGEIEHIITSPMPPNLDPYSDEDLRDFVVGKIKRCLRILDNRRKGAE